jgi:hypothetical protein
MAPRRSLDTRRKMASRALEVARDEHDRAHTRAMRAEVRASSLQQLAEFIPPNVHDLFTIVLRHANEKVASRAFTLAQAEAELVARKRALQNIGAEGESANHQESQEPMDTTAADPPLVGTCSVRGCKFPSCHRCRACKETLCDGHVCRYSIGQTPGTAHVTADGVRSVYSATDMTHAPGIYCKGCLFG